MARNIFKLSRDERGFTLTEVTTVCAIVGVLGVMAFPSMQRFNRVQETKSGATQMAGVLEDARSRAVSEATPHLVYVNDPGVAPGEGEGSGECGPLAVVVRDSDRSYSITDGDAVREVKLPSSACDKVKLYGEDEASTPFETMHLPMEDQAVLDRGLLGGLTDPNGLVGGALGGVGEILGGGDDDEEDDDSSGPGSGSSGSGSGRSGESSGSGSSGSGEGELRTEEVANSVVNGSTFPVDETSGRPVIAFSERGIPVDPRNPTSWGSGAGAIYLTDGEDAVYAAVVQPMGSIKLRKYEPTTGAWR